MGVEGGKPHIAPPPRKALWAWILMVRDLLEFTRSGAILFCVLPKRRPMVFQKRVSALS